MTTQKITQDIAMATYRGVEQDKITESISQAMQFFGELNIGPANDELMKQWMQTEPLEWIGNARHNGELLNSLQGGLTAQLCKFYEPLLAFHALSASIERDDNGAMEIYKGLKAWDAFRQNCTLENPAAMRELNDYLLREYAARWDDEVIVRDSDQDAAFEAGMRELFDERIQNAMFDNLEDDDDEEFFKKFEKAETPVMDLAKSLAPVFSMLYSSDHADQITVLSAENPLAADYALKGMVSAGPFAAHADMLDVIWAPIQDYRLELGPAPKDEKDFSNLVIKAQSKMDNWRNAYIGLDELMENIGFFTNDKNQVVMEFAATRRAAQALANAQPQYKVFDRNNRVIEPRDLKRKNDGPAP